MSSLGIGSEGRVYVGLMSGTSLDGISAAVVRFADNLGASTAGDDRRATLLAFRVTPYTRRAARAPAQGADRRHGAGVLPSQLRPRRLARRRRVGVIADAGVARERDARDRLARSDDLARAAAFDLADRRSRGHRRAHRHRRRERLSRARRRRRRPGRAARADRRRAALLRRTAGARCRTSAASATSRSCRRTARLDGVRAFDTGPGASVIDRVVRALVPGLAYDVDGRLAAAGTPIDEVVDGASRARRTSRALRPSRPAGSSSTRATCKRSSTDAAPLDRMRRRRTSIATATSLTARSIADAYRRFLPEPITEVLVSGGGARNPTLVAHDQATSSPPSHVRQFADEFFDGEAKEAVAFALLAYLHVHEAPGQRPARDRSAWGPYTRQAHAGLRTKGARRKRRVERRRVEKSASKRARREERVEKSASRRARRKRRVEKSASRRARREGRVEKGASRSGASRKHALESCNGR